MIAFLFRTTKVQFFSHSIVLQENGEREKIKETRAIEEYTQL
jgi:hypothetical protein